MNYSDCLNAVSLVLESNEVPLIIGESGIGKTSLVKRIAKDLSVSEKTVRRAVQDLEKAELIRKEYAYRKNGSHTSNRYYVL